jgi:hypothetical protein
VFRGVVFTKYYRYFHDLRRKDGGEERPKLSLGAFVQFDIVVSLRSIVERLSHPPLWISKYRWNPLLTLYWEKWD